MRSDKLKKGLERMPNRSLLLATGLTPGHLKRPFIGIASSFTDLVPGHVDMRSLERFIERGIEAAGGTPFIFGSPAICDGIAMGHSGMKYSLPSRELIADIIETMSNAHQLDALVLLTDCDKITPGMVMGAARINIPAVVVTAGPMLSGRSGKRKLSLVRDTFEAVGRFKKGQISGEERLALEMEACPTCGACQGMYTANTMACLTEAMGLSLPGCATTFCFSAAKKRIAYESGMAAVRLAKRNTRIRSILNKKSLENAIRVDMALGGSTNSVLHLMAIANEAGVSLGLKDFDRLSKSTPNICHLRPAGNYMMEDLGIAGGIPAVLKRLGGKLKDNRTVAFKTIKTIAREAVISDSDIIRPLDKAYRKQGGLAILYGNLAKDGCVVKQSAVNPKMMRFKGRARIFNAEEDAMRAILGGKIKRGDCIVIRYEGPAGGPGMREMLSPTSAIVGLGMQNSVALITDGRFSGGTKGPCIGHISPEAQAGGVIAILKENDIISIDIPKRKLEVRLSKAEIEGRRKKLRPASIKAKGGYLAKYAKLVSSADKGAILS
ncbi:dihydroxy-acid dehydratase [Candidatus Omnitrophota bacterium]